MNKPNMTKRLEEFKTAGIGGVEICLINGAKGSEDKYLEFLSPPCVEMLAHSTTEAKRLGFGVDLTTGTGWPFDGPWVNDGDAAAKVTLQKYTVEAGTKVTDRLPPGKVHCVRAVSNEMSTLDLTDLVKNGRLDWTALAGA